MHAKANVNGPVSACCGGVGKRRGKKGERIGGEMKCATSAEEGGESPKMSKEKGVIHVKIGSREGKGELNGGRGKKPKGEVLQKPPKEKH